MVYQVITRICRECSDNVPDVLHVPMHTAHCAVCHRRDISAPWYVVYTDNISQLRTFDFSIVTVIRIEKHTLDA